MPDSRPHRRLFESFHLNLVQSDDVGAADNHNVFALNLSSEPAALSFVNFPRTSEAFRSSGHGHLVPKSFSKPVQIAGACVISNDLQIDNGIIKPPSNIWLDDLRKGAKCAKFEKTEQDFFWTFSGCRPNMLPA